MDTQVLIVGAGPTGLMLANQLARRGVRALIIDRHPGPAQQTRALGVQARTLEIYAHLGLIERALELGKRATGANLWAQGRCAARIPVGDIGRDISPYPYLFILGQDDNERLLGDALRDHGLDVSWNTELVGLVQHADHAVAMLKQSDGRVRELRAAWVAGCDGAHSAVRRLNDIAFPGAPYEHVFFVADVQITGTMVPDELNVYLWRQGFHLFFPMRGSDHWRLVGIVPPALRDKDDLSFDDVLPSLRTEAGADLAFTQCTWFSTYRIHHRRAGRFRERRCFLLGDAAHIHSPVGAQGMNTGLQDAYNLAWKLALVVTGRAATTLLNSYADERMPVARRLLETTDRGFSLLVSDSWLAGLFRTRILVRMAAFAMRFERVRQLAFRTISQTGIHYADSTLSEQLGSQPLSGPRAGDRFPWLRLRLRADGPVEDLFAVLDDTRFHLILIGQAAPAEALPELDGLLDIHAVPDGPDNARELARTGIPARAFYLLRPDGHVGLTGSDWDAGSGICYLRDRLQVVAKSHADRIGN